MLPNFIPYRDADIILFIGSSLHLFEWDLYQENPTFVGKQKLALPAGDWMTSEVGGKREQGILQEKELEFMRDIQELMERKRFDLQDLEKTLDKIRSTVAKELWDLCVVKAKLVSQLMMLKDFYLLGLGELFLVLIEEASVVLRKLPTKTTEYDLNQAFRRSAVKVQLEEDGEIQNFSLVIGLIYSTELIFKIQ